MVDIDREEHLIRVRTSAALVLTLGCFGLGHLALPRYFAFPGPLADRLAFAAQANAFILLCLLVGIGLVSIGRRRSPADIGGAAAGPPSPRLAIKSAFLQNTLEQAVLTWGAFFAFAAVVDGALLALVPVSVVLFCGGRVLFYRGYPSGAGARAFGMALTLLPGTLLLVFVVAQTTWRLLQGVVG